MPSVQAAENGLALTAGASKRAPSPPFAAGQQLTMSHNTNFADANELLIEQTRLKRALRDEDLEVMHRRLWYAGRKGNISPLHHQKVILRDIVLTEKARLHLVWYEKTIYVKRLEEDILNWEYFSKIVCSDQVTYWAATGFLQSYMSLIEYPSDLAIAKASGLVGNNISWTSWRDFRSEVLSHLANRSEHDRYEYGELRLSRLNQIYRTKFLGLSYFNIYRDYSSYFGDNYMTLVALFALVSVALSAMQVMTSIDGVPRVVAVTSYRFAIATLVTLGGSCVVLFSLYVGLYVWNWLLIFDRYLEHRK